MDSDNTGLSDVIDELESELDTLITRLEALEGERDGYRAALYGFVDIMREDGHTDLTAEQVYGMVDVVRLSRAIATTTPRG